MPGVLAMGTWRSGSGDDFVVIRRRRAGVVIDLEGPGEFSRVILSTRHALELVQALQLEIDEEPTDVVELATGAVRTPEPAPKTRTRRAPKPAPAT